MDQEYFKIELDVNAPDTANVDEEYEYRFSFALKGDPIISEIHAEFYINWDSCARAPGGCPGSPVYCRP